MKHDEIEYFASQLAKQGHIVTYFLIHTYLKDNILYYHPLTSTEYEMFAIFQRLQSRQFSTNRDETLTRHNFRHWFIRVQNIEALALFLYAELACTNHPMSRGTDRRTDGQTDRQTDRHAQPHIPPFHGG